MSEDTHSVGQVTGNTNSLLNHSIESVLYLFLVLNKYLPLGMLDWGNARVCPDSRGPGHVANGVKGAWEGSL